MKPVAPTSRTIYKRVDRFFLSMKNKNKNKKNFAMNRLWTKEWSQHQQSFIHKKSLIVHLKKLNNKKKPIELFMHQ